MSRIEGVGNQNLGKDLHPHPDPGRDVILRARFASQFFEEAARKGHPLFATEQEWDVHSPIGGEASPVRVLTASTGVINRGLGEVHVVACDSKGVVSVGSISIAPHYGFLGNRQWPKRHGENPSCFRADARRAFRKGVNAYQVLAVPAIYTMILGEEDGLRRRDLPTTKFSDSLGPKTKHLRSLHGWVDLREDTPDGHVLKTEGTIVPCPTWGTAVHITDRSVSSHGEEVQRVSAQLLQEMWGLVRSATGGIEAPPPPTDILRTSMRSPYKLEEL